MNKRDVKTREDLELYYNQCRKIRFADGIKPNNIAEIFELIKDKINSKPTYFKNGSEHCDNGRYRSIDDYIKLCKFYFPETKLKDIVKTIEYYILNKCKEGRFIRVEWCPNIRKDNCRYSHYFNERYHVHFKIRSIVDQGFPNCQITYNNILQWD